MVTRWECLPRKLQGITRRPNWLSGAAHTCWDDRRDANLRRSHRVVEQKTARDEVAIPSHHAPAAHRVHSREGRKQLNRVRRAQLRLSRNIGEDLRNALGKENGHRLLWRLTSSHAVKRPSRKPRSARSRWTSKVSWCSSSHAATKASTLSWARRRSARAFPTSP